MEGVDKVALLEIAKAPVSEIKYIIQAEGPNLVVTKSLLNVLHNLILVGSIPVTTRKRAFFDQEAHLVAQLLSSSQSLAWKKRVLEANPSVALNIATSCPFVDLFSSQKTATNN